MGRLVIRDIGQKTEEKDWLNVNDWRCERLRKDCEKESKEVRVLVPKRG